VNWNPTRRPPTDREILQAIYNRHRKDFTAGADERATKIFVPVDIVTVSTQLRVDPDIVFGRLYYVLEQRFGYVRADGSRVNFFTLQAGADFRAVNFPMLVSALAALREDHDRQARATWIAIAALAVSVASFAISLFPAALSR